MRVELRDPPVVFAGGIGGDVGEGFGVGRPIELVDVEAGGRDDGRRGRLGSAGIGYGDALDLNAIFSDDAGGRLHGRECAGGTGSVFNVEEGDGFSVGRKGRRMDVAFQIGETEWGIAVEVGEIEIGLGFRLIGGGVTAGEEGEGGGVRGPGEAAFSTALAG